jgi:hypothetical protein
VVSDRFIIGCEFEEDVRWLVTYYLSGSTTLDLSFILKNGVEAVQKVKRRKKLSK